MVASPLAVAPLASGRGLHTLLFQLNLSSSIHRIIQLNSSTCPGLLELSSNVNECKPLASGCETALCQGLMGTASRNPQDLSLITALPVGDANKNVPDASKFRRHLSKGDEPLPPLPPQEVFARHAANVVKTSAIRNASSVGVYALPSFINHSCAPNCQRLLIGHTMFIRAARDLGRDLHSSISQLNVSTFSGIGGVFGACLGVFWGCKRVSGGVKGVFL